MKLSKRLLAIAKLVPKNSIVADIGSDHGLVLIYLAKNNLIQKGYGVENKVGPFNILKRALKPFYWQNLIPILSDGLLNLASDVNCLVLAGMGGENIINILEKGKENLKNVQFIICDPHTLIPSVRMFLSKNQFLIEDEMLIYEKNQFYEISLYQKTKKEIKYSSFEINYGPYISKSSLFPFFAKKRIIKIEQLLKKDLPQKNKQLLLKERKELLPYANKYLT